MLLGKWRTYVTASSQLVDIGVYCNAGEGGGGESNVRYERVSVKCLQA